MVIASKGGSFRSSGLGIYDQYIEALLDEHTDISCDSSSMKKLAVNAMGPYLILRLCWNNCPLRFSNCSERFVKKNQGLHGLSFSQYAFCCCVIFLLFYSLSLSSYQMVEMLIWTITKTPKYSVPLNQLKDPSLWSHHLTRNVTACSSRQLLISPPMSTAILLFNIFC